MVKQKSVITVKMNMYYQIQNVLVIQQLNIVNQKIIKLHLVYLGIDQINMKYIVKCMLYGG